MASTACSTFEHFASNSTFGQKRFNRFSSTSRALSSSSTNMAFSFSTRQTYLLPGHCGLNFHENHFFFSNGLKLFPKGQGNAHSCTLRRIGIIKSKLLTKMLLQNGKTPVDGVYCKRFMSSSLPFFNLFFSLSSYSIVTNFAAKYSIIQRERNRQMFPSFFVQKSMNERIFNKGLD